MAHTERVIILVDMDCFYCQVEEKLDPSLEGKPIAVVQYNAWRGGGIIAVNYPAREKGVTRHMRGDEAKQKCPEIVLARVPEVRGKADLTKYREAGKRVAEVLQTFTSLLERASVDEAYLDITDAVIKRVDQDFEKVCIENMQNTYVVGQDTNNFLYNVHIDKDYSETNCRLAMGGLIAEEIRADVYKKTGYKCSAGIAHNKILAKLAAGLNKPNKQTIIPQESVPTLYKDLPLKKIKSLGGKFGDALSEDLRITNMGELIRFSEKELMKRFDEKTANWLYNIARGINLEPVTVRLISKSIGCCKKFPGRSALITSEDVEHWMNELASEISERLQKDLEENNRRAKQMVISFAQEINKKDISSSRTLSLNSYEQIKIAQSGLETIRKFCLKVDGTYKIKFLGISVGNFEENKKVVNITTFFKNMESRNLKKSPVNYKEMISSPNIEILKENQLSSENEGNKKVYTDSSASNSLANLIASVTENNNNNDKNDNTNDKNNLNDLKETTSSEEKNCDDDDENTSVYSATTEELNEDTKNLIYYEDIYPESVASQPIFEKKSSDMSINHDTKSLSYLSDNSNSSNDMYGLRSSTSSFFAKYFENATDESSNSSPFKRNFDTSKILEENEMEYSTESINIDEVPIQNVEEGIVDNKPRNSQVEVKQQEKAVDEQFDFRETCPECNKKVLSYEFVSHMDYHYALKMVREEAHLYKPTQTIEVPNPVKIEKTPMKQGTKRKNAKDPKEIKPIFTYLQKEELNEENSELCSECHKKIKFEDIASHIDFHAAKKLHLEINSCSSAASSKPDKSNIKPKNKNKVVKATRNISHFFKPS